MRNPTPQTPKRRATLFFAASILAVVGAAVILYFLVENRRGSVKDERDHRETDGASGRRVRVVSATRGPDTRTVVLLGEARPYTTVTLYAKLSGYLREIRVDKGDRVEAGQVLAIIESPELDRQYDAALADAKQKRVDAERAKRLLPEKAIPMQVAEQAEAAAQVAEATAKSLEAQKQYEILAAPFPAKVTARFVDPGALVQAATSSQTTNQPIVTLSETDRLRIYAYVDQKNASFVRLGDRAEVADRARPDVKLPVTVSRISGELDLNTRTLLTELDLDNRLGKILPGSFVQVSLSIRMPSYVEIPATALRMKGEKASVGVVSPDNRLTLRSVAIAESDGKTVRLSSGLRAGEKVILDPGEGVADGERIQPVMANSQ